MLPRAGRITTKEFPAILKRSTPYHSPLMSLRVALCSGRPAGFSVVVSVKTAKQAVERNRIKRRLRHLLVKHGGGFKSGYCGLIFAKKEVLHCSFEELEDTLIVLLKKAGIL